VHRVLVNPQIRTKYEENPAQHDNALYHGLVATGFNATNKPGTVGIETRQAALPLIAETPQDPKG